MTNDRFTEQESTDRTANTADLEPLYRVPHLLVEGTSAFPPHDHAPLEITCVLRGKLGVILSEGGAVLEAGDILFAVPHMLHGYRHIMPEAGAEPMTDGTDGDDPDQDLLSRYFGGTDDKGKTADTRPVTLKIMVDPASLGTVTTLLETCIPERPVLKRKMLEEAIPDIYGSLARTHRRYPQETRTAPRQEPAHEAAADIETAGEPLADALLLQEIILKLFALTLPKRQKIENRSIFTELVRLCCDRCTDDEFSVETAAAQLGVSPSRIRELFSKNMHIGFGRYLSMLRMDRAAVLLTETAVSVTDIALNCGYSSASSFNRAFTEKFGVSPTLYRQTGGRGSRADRIDREDRDNRDGTEEPV